MPVARKQSFSVAHAERRTAALLAPNRQVSPTNIFAFDYALWRGDVEAFLDELPTEPLFDLIVTSPPYNIGKEYESRIELDKYSNGRNESSES